MILTGRLVPTGDILYTDVVSECLHYCVSLVKITLGSWDHDDDDDDDKLWKFGNFQVGGTSLTDQIYTQFKIKSWL
jgi:hypothetical protein